MASTIAFTIGGVDYSTVVDVLSIDITQGLSSRSDTINFKIALTSAMVTTTGPYPPVSSQVVSLTVNGVKEFEGPIAAVRTNPRGSLDAFSFECTATDYTKFFDRLLVAKTTVPADFAGNIAIQLINQYAPDFSTINIQQGFQIPEQSYDYEALSSIMDKLAQSVGYSWYIDFNKDVHFYSVTDESAPLPILNIDTDLNIGNVLHTEDTTRLKNRIYVKDATVKSSSTRSDQYVADGRQAFFPLFASPYDVADVKATVDGIEVPVKLDPLTNSAGDLAGGDGFCFICLINSGIRFGSDNIPPAGSLVDIVYSPTQQGEFVDIVEDPDSIRMMSARENSSGIYEHVISLPDYRVADMSPLHAVALLYLDRLAWPVIAGSFETLNIQGWRPGQSMVIQSAKRNLYDAKIYWKIGISTAPSVYIQSVNKKINPTMTSTGFYYRINNTVQYSNLVNEASF